MLIIRHISKIIIVTSAQTKFKTKFRAVLECNVHLTRFKPYLLTPKHEIWRSPIPIVKIHVSILITDSVVKSISVLIIFSSLVHLFKFSFTRDEAFDTWRSFWHATKLLTQPVICRCSYLIKRSVVQSSVDLYKRDETRTSWIITL
jgi:hypothetical protein